MLEIKKLSKSFGNKKVLDQISLSLADGEILSIVGPSGGGKTTLLRCISGLEEKDAGEILIDGEKIEPTEHQVGSNRIGVVFQDFNLFPHLSVLENLALAPIMTNTSNKKAAEDEGLEILAQFQLADKANNYPFELSGGQKQRVAICRALVMHPKVLCYDEPTSALDPALRDNVAEIILDLKEKQMTQIVVTHDHDFAKKIADQLIEVEPIK